MVRKIVDVIPYTVAGLVVVALSLFIFSIVSSERLGDQEERALPQFAALNEAVYAQIPPPRGASEEHVFRDPIEIQEHGVHLRAEYQTTGLSTADALNYYDKLLLSQGWQIDDPNSSEDYRTYYRKSACVQLNLYGDPNGPLHGYSVTVYHDFWAQDFSPKRPPQWVLDLDSFGLFSEVLRCPPELGYED